MSATKNKSLLQNNGLVLALSGLAVLVCYTPALQNGFTYWDDQKYVLQNPYLNFSFRNVLAVFSGYFFGNYQPLTLLSLSVSHLISNYNASGYILTNIIFHAANAALLFLLLRRLDFSPFIAFLSALLFAIHPLHVESAVWIAGRKDVLYVFFFFLSLIYYTRYHNSKGKSDYFLSMLFFILSCLSKGQAVVLAAVLFLIDYLLTGQLFQPKKISSKIPFLLLAVLFGIIAMKAQATSIDEITVPPYSAFQRIAFASHSYLSYIIQTAVPHRLIAFYPYPSTFQPYFYLFVPAALLVFISAVYYFRKNRTVVFSILFFSVCIFPLLQLVPVGVTISADRYSYLAGVGLLILIAYAAEYFFKRKKTAATIFISIYLIFLAQYTFSRCSTWKNGITLWTDVIEKYPNCSLAYCNLGASYYAKGNVNAAMDNLQKALKADSSNSDARYNAAMIYYGSNDYSNCIKMLAGIDTTRHANNDTYLLKAYSEFKLHDYNSSLRNVKSFLQRNPSAEAFTLSGLNNIMTGDFKNAKNDLDKAIATDSSYADAYLKRGLLFLNTGDTISACTNWQKAFSLGSEEANGAIKTYCTRSSGSN